MFPILDHGAPLCDGLTRRDWLRIGGIGAAVAANTPAGPRQRGATAGKAKSCIVLFFLGGPPQHETWDPKPDAPAEIRGDLSADPHRHARPAGRRADAADRQADRQDRRAARRHHRRQRPLLQRLLHDDRPSAPADQRRERQARRAQRLAQPRRRGPPAETRRPATCPPPSPLPEQSANDGNLTWPGQDAGFLGRTADPWLLHCDPAAADFHIPGLQLPADVPPLRFDDRRALLEQVNRHLDGVPRASWPLLRRPEPAGLRPAVVAAGTPGVSTSTRSPPRSATATAGPTSARACLLARRLVEAGVSLVHVNWTRVAGRP